MFAKNLLCVKSIITILLTAAFCALTFLYPETYEETMKTVITSVITFYFAHQMEKTRREADAGNKSDNTGKTGQ